MIQRQQLRLSEEWFDLIVEQKLFDERIIDTIRMLNFLSTNWMPLMGQRIKIKSGGRVKSTVN